MGKYDNLVRQGILELKPYIPGKPVEEVQRELGLTAVIKLASNETAAGPSPLAVEAIRAEAARVNYYPEGLSTPLRDKLAARLGVDADMLIVSNGADNVIGLVGMAFVNPGDEVLMAEVTFPAYETITRIMGGTVVTVPLKNYAHDLEAMAAAITPRTKLVFLCNPNNPTGVINTREEVDRFMARVPADVIVVMDEAYWDYVDDPAYPDSLDYLRGDKPVIGIRTFSKIAGIAGVRIGYAMAAEELIGYMRRVVEPFAANRIAQVAALAAMDDQAHRAEVLRLNREGRDYFHAEFAALGLAYSQSQANFVFVDTGMDTGELFDGLLREGVIVRPGKVWGIPTCVRITIGTAEENRRCVAALKQVLGR